MATKYVKTIDDFYDLVNPRTLAHHFLGSEPLPFNLRAIKIKEKSKFCFEFSLYIYIYIYIIDLSRGPYSRMETDYLFWGTGIYSLEEDATITYV